MSAAQKARTITGLSEPEARPTKAPRNAIAVISENHIQLRRPARAGDEEVRDLGTECEDLVDACRAHAPIASALANCGRRRFAAFAGGVGGCMAGRSISSGGQYLPG